ncbi:transcriptional regulator GlxA family with amidase domain [Parabacteroides sp. PF5-5]|uniref:GlxA family transcriptional regulator n=1 Tax=unclassified Parabacteroides TaxID=2649774 RepID=UPI0024742171|nr:MULTISPECIES: helix-turn-helix domain-containing protein [unclassified Parabacteroides]MDH6303713.1 transcriptional regulator GlxA family with amidase domain [Parabacteroides sp. PH5-39]MDH6314330.1 transcriptional regulator GlxA family with amidase domain [Parabacteroides sp. PF5-13]MDH6318606.1 transcriptional regulator GlxA family with amidase domain [Parabacteroides sp. PH5-13]MDH6322102.1 transcriptional regulator GlxA family with amidase domain [Parabacteroides sp. PH5-8]MDH6325819.1 
MNSCIRHIVFLIIPDATLLDITGPYEVFSQAIEYIQTQEKKTDFSYELHSVSVDKKKNVRTASGVTMLCSENIKTINYPIDTLIIPGVSNTRIEAYKLSGDVLKWIGEQSGKVRRICSICTGSFFLAEAGILKDRRVTTHWEKCHVLKSNYPEVEVDSDPIFIKDDHIYTSVGISSGMDLALALVEEDLGKTVALEVAKQMVLYLKRPGSQSQYSSILTHQHTDYKPIQEACYWIQEHLQEDITIDSLSEIVSMSPRNFSRAFVRETGITPAKYLNKLRVETACRYLVDTHLSLKEISELCGLGSPDNMRKVFFKCMQLSPAGYRKSFRTTFSSDNLKLI